jgi:hypothetical protein
VNLIRNERIKLFATALNNLAVATMAAAIIAPVAGILYGSTAVASTWWPLLALAWISVGIGLHIGAQRVLGRLKE